MKVVVAAGGTGGHLYPALALVEYIKKQDPNSKFLFIGTKDRLESQVVPQLGYDYVGLNVKGLAGNPLKKAYAALLFVKSIGKAKKVIKKFNPDIVVGFGGYPSASALEAAASLKIKTMIHEQNSIIGLTNKILIKKVDKIICCYQKAYEEFPQEKTLLLGNPRASVVSHEVPKDIYDKYGLDRNKKVVTIVMGSLGSSKVNEILVKTMKLFNKKDYEILFITGNDDYEKIKQNKFPSDVHVVAYVENLIRVMKKTDLIVSRAGASTLSEIIALSLPSILIPSPYVPDNHQFKNAKDLIDKKAALLIEEKNLKGDILVRTIDDVINNEDKINEIKNNLKEFKIENSATLIYNNIKEIVDGSK